MRPREISRAICIPETIGVCQGVLRQAHEIPCGDYQAPLPCFVNNAKMRIASFAEVSYIGVGRFRRNRQAVWYDFTNQVHDHYNLYPRLDHKLIAALVTISNQNNRPRVLVMKLEPDYIISYLSSYRQSCSSILGPYFLFLFLCLTSGLLLHKLQHYQLLRATCE